MSQTRTFACTLPMPRSPAEHEAKARARNLFKLNYETSLYDNPVRDEDKALAAAVKASDLSKVEAALALGADPNVVLNPGPAQRGSESPFILAFAQVTRKRPTEPRAAEMRVFQRLLKCEGVDVQEGRRLLSVTPFASGGVSTGCGVGLGPAGRGCLH